MLAYGPGIQQRHLVLLTLAPNGMPIRTEVPTAATIMRPYPTPTYLIVNFQVAASGGITLYFVDPSSLYFFDFIHPGIDGLWNNSGDETRKTFGDTQPTTLNYPPRISEDGEFVTWAEGVPPLIWRLFDAGPDHIPNTPDDRGPFNINPPQTNPSRAFLVRGIGGTIPSTPFLQRPSAVRVLAESGSQNPLIPEQSYFFESGQDQSPGAPDIYITPIPNLFSGTVSDIKVLALESEGNITLFSRGIGYNSFSEPILRAIRWCYQ